MSVSKIGIINMALTHLGASSITSLTDDTKESREANIVYDNLRRSLLRSHPWNFAIGRRSLAQLTETPDFGYSYQYQLPNDCLRALLMFESSSDFSVEGRKLLTNDTSVNLIYIKDVEDTGLFDSLFVELLALKIANTLAYSIAGSNELDQVKLDRMKTLMRQAKQYDGQEGTPPKWMQVDWLNNFDLGT